MLEHVPPPTRASGRPVEHRAHGNGTIQVNVGFPAVLLDQVEARARQLGVTRTDYLRSLAIRDLEGR